METGEGEGRASGGEEAGGVRRVGRRAGGSCRVFHRAVLGSHLPKSIHTSKPLLILHSPSRLCFIYLLFIFQLPTALLPSGAKMLTNICLSNFLASLFASETNTASEAVQGDGNSCGRGGW